MQQAPVVARPMQSSQSPQTNGVNGPRTYQCAHCSKAFARKAHMLRHQSQHGSQKPFSCQFCSKTFKRSDVLRAHLFRCDQRGSEAVPECKSKGRKKSSCISCVKLRTKCDAKTPCTRCEEDGRECIRDPEVENGNLSAIEQSRSTLPFRNSGAISIDFLLNSPPGDDLVSRFPIRESSTQADAGDDVAMVQLQDHSGTQDWQTDPRDPFFGVEFNFEDLMDQLPLNLELPLSHVDFAPHAIEQESFSMALAFEPKALEVRQVLHRRAAKLDNRPEIMHMATQGASIELLTAVEIEASLSLYFQYYHRHCPIIHRPTFNPLNAQPALLLAMIALGGMYCKDPIKIAWHRSLFDLIELYIFTLPGVRDEHHGSIDLAAPADEITMQRNFETFQGAYLITVCQYFSGNTTARRRARREKFLRLITLARAFGLPTAQHDKFQSIPDGISFQRWLRQESGIRIMNIMLAFDSAFGIFNNIPPRIDFAELDVQLMCDPEYFEMNSYDDMLSRSLFPRSKMKTLDALYKFFIPNDGSARFEPIEKDALNMWDMMVLVHLLYRHIWKQLYSDPALRLQEQSYDRLQEVLEPLKTAVKNWKTVWDEVKASIPRDSIPTMGFETSSDGYWGVTHLLVQRFDQKIEGMRLGEWGLIDTSSCFDFLPYKTDCDEQSGHLRKLLRGVNWAPDG